MAFPDPLGFDQPRSASVNETDLDFSLSSDLLRSTIGSPERSATAQRPQAPPSAPAKFGFHSNNNNVEETNNNNTVPELQDTLAEAAAPVGSLPGSLAEEEDKDGTGTGSASPIKEPEMRPPTAPAPQLYSPAVRQPSAQQTTSIFPPIGNNSIHPAPEPPPPQNPQSDPGENEVRK